MGSSATPSPPAAAAWWLQQRRPSPRPPEPAADNPLAAHRRRYADLEREVADPATPAGAVVDGLPGELDELERLQRHAARRPPAGP